MESTKLEHGQRQNNVGMLLRDAVKWMRVRLTHNNVDGYAITSKP